MQPPMNHPSEIPPATADSASPAADDRLFAHIHGCLAAVAVGDALGFPVHDLTREEILRRYGGPVDRLRDAFDDDPIHPGYRAGQVTDDTILTLVTAEAILAADGDLTNGGMAAALGRWAAGHENLWRPGSVFGPSSKAAFAALARSPKTWTMDMTRGRAHMGASNGAVMRVAPAGLAHPGDVERAVRTACAAVAPTHGTQVSMAAAAAQAAAVAEAVVDGSDVFSVVRAALAGARLGEAIGRAEARQVPAPSIERRLELAVSLALAATDPHDAGERLQALIGTGLPAADALPSAIGMFVASGGDPRTGMVAAATMGGDTDTQSSICGALCGALRGIDAVPWEWVEQVEHVNHLALEQAAARLAALARRRAMS
ncbi:MAG: ADP-ribosylglycohydrolase family protein [Thermoleophilia bacterium]